jgi:Ca-activated chloride channel family protein
MPDKPTFDTIGDEPLEARIVAWVLGDASAFEAAELERLCTERPELLVFRRRMRALHNLLSEAEAQEADHSVKLPPEKRKALDAIFGAATPTVVLDHQPEARRRFSASRTLLAIAACLTLLLVVAGFFSSASISRKCAQMDASAGKLVPLQTEYPPELIEGTPKAILTNLKPIPYEAPVRQELAAREEEKYKLAATDEAAKFAMAENSAWKQSSLERRSTSTPAAAAKPAKPTSDIAAAKPPSATAAAKPSATARAKPMPAIAGSKPSPPAAAAPAAAKSSPPADAAPLASASSRMRTKVRAPEDGASNDLARRSSEYEIAADKKGKDKEGYKYESGNSPGADVPTSEQLPLLGTLMGGAKHDLAIRGGHDYYDSSFLSRNSGELSLDLALQVDPPSLKEPQPTNEIFRKFNKPAELAGLAVLRSTAGDAAGLAPAAANAEIAKLLEKPVEAGQELDEKTKPEVQPEVNLTAEGTAAAAPYSTFSLSISDASFKMAQAALARGERPEPASIKLEQFYNAVDYGDPAPSSSEPVAAWVEQAAHPVIPARNLVRVALRTGAAGRSAAQPLRLTLLVDQSGSMAREDRRLAMQNALTQLAGLLTKNDLVTIIGFSRRPRLLADALPGDQAALLNEVVNQAASEGGTNLEEALKLGEQMALQHQSAGAQNRIVLFTDGAANLGAADPLRLAEMVKALRQKGLAFDIAGIGTNDLNDRLLGELARHGNGRYSVAGAETDADGSFARQLAGAFRPAAENVKVQVRFNPQRVGKYKLLGFEEHRLKTEDFRNDAVDAAELAAEEAGVALYQVEPLADGSGEIGEVSVRFRDAASGRMVERSWTIPYEATAPAFDQSAPSLQLAGLAMLAAEKLRGGPLAEAIDFKLLAAPRATVKQYYSNSRRVAEMLEVINKL